MPLENSSPVALSRQMALRQQMDVIANNIANVNTPAFKGTGVLFEEYLAKINDGSKLSYVQDLSTYRDMREGGFTTTGNDLDVAIRGEGFLVVRTPDGDRYTRNGHLTTNERGELVTSAGHQVLSDGGAIVIPNDTRKIEIAPDGTVSIAQMIGDGATANTEGRLGTLRVVTFENNQALRNTGNGFYQSDQAPRAAKKGSYSIAQGMIEESNVQPVMEMTKMIQVMRAYQSTQKLMDNGHDMEMQAIDKLTPR